MSELISLQKLFKDSIFRIPDYQRWYSWRDLQLEELRSDVINLLPWKEHYTGMLSLKKLDEDYVKDWNDEEWLIKNKWYIPYHIVDGQQRLTTLIILIKAIVNYYQKINQGKSDDEIILNDTPLSEIISQYLVIKKPWDIIKTYKFWYEKDNPSFEFFKTRILESETPWHLEETFYTLNLENAKNYFARKVEELALTNEKKLDAVGDLFRKITQKLVFNMYYIDDDFNVFIAFETMNNRWKKLSNLELLKNRLIYLSTLFDMPKADQEVLRRNINDTWKTVYWFLGKDKTKSLDDDEFLQNHWMIYFWYTRSNKVTYDSFLLNDYFTQQNIFNEPPLDYSEEDDDDVDENEDWVDENDDWSNDNSELEYTKLKVWLSKNSKLQPVNIKNYIDSMKQLIHSWYLIHHPEENQNKNISINLERLNRLWFVNFKPLATVILADKNIPEETKAECFRLMERFVFLHYRLDWYFWTYKNSFFYNLAHQLYNGEIKLDEVIEQLEKIDYLSDNKVANANWIISKSERNFKNYKWFYSWANLKYFLFEYERTLDSTTEKIFPKDFFKKDEKDRVSVEHIYPQTPDDDSWILPFESYTTNEKKYLTNSLWNLLPLSQSINSSLQNYPFEVKKEKRYADGSHSEIEVSRYNQWTPQEILERWLKMVKFMEQRWWFVFETRYDRIKFLWLEFMATEEDKTIDETTPINESKEQSKNTNKEYSEEQMGKIIKISNEDIKNLYKIFNMHCIKLEWVEKYTTENYVAYTVDKKIIFRIWFNKESFSIYSINWEYEDPLKKFFNWWSWRNTDVKMFVRDNNDLNYAVNKLLPQAYEIWKQQK